MKNIVVVDIDGTISKVGDRLKYLQQDKKDWDSFYEHCDEDTPIKDIIKLVHDLFDAGYKILFCTGRRESVRRKTELWINKNTYLESWYDLIMRKDNDWRPDSEVKPELLHKYLIENNATKDNVFIILEDRDSMVNKWRELEYTCLQVADGNY